MFEVEMDETEEEKDQRVWESRREREKVESGMKKEKSASRVEKDD